VALVKVDVVGAEPAQAGVQGSGQVHPGEPAVVRARPGRHGGLGRDHDRVSPALDGAAEDLLSLAVVVVARRINEVVAGVEESIDEPSSRGFIDT
jgi:hypothetical protein